MMHSSSEMNVEAARINMIAHQMRCGGVLAPNVLELLQIVKREDFVPAAYTRLAFADTEIPLGHGATMLSPIVEGLAMQAVAMKKHERVLEVGSGSGYMAALLGAHAEHVRSMEIVPELVQQAQQNLRRAGVSNVTVEQGNGLAGMASQAPFDVIMISGAVTTVPQVLIEQLKVGGRMFVIVGEAPAMQAQLITRVTGKDGVGKSIRTETLFETVADPLVPVAAASSFVF